MSLAVKLAREVLEMHERICELTFALERAKHFEQKYNDLINDNIKHSEQMIGGMFAVGLKMARMQADTNPTNQEPV